MTCYLHGYVPARMLRPAVTERLAVDLDSTSASFSLLHHHVQDSSNVGLAKREAAPFAPVVDQACDRHGCYPTEVALEDRDPAHIVI